MADRQSHSQRGDSRMYQQQQQPQQQGYGQASPPQLRGDPNYGGGYGAGAGGQYQQGRSQTMTSGMSYPAQGGRSNTMTSQGSYQQQPAARQNGYPQQQQQQQYAQQGANGYPPQQRQQQQAPQQRVPQGQYYQQQQGGYPPQQQQQPQQQGHPAERRPFPQPMRMNAPAAGAAPGQYQAFSRGGPGGSGGPAPGRNYPPVAPALNSDPNRSRSLANPQAYAGAQAGIRQSAVPDPMMAQGGYRPNSSAQNATRTTAQGRIVPERHDERAMSLTSYSHDREQTMSGRVIPHRRKESEESTASEYARTSTMPSSSNYNHAAKARTPSQASNISSTKTMSFSGDHSALKNRPSMPNMSTAASATPSRQSSRQTSGHMVATSSRRPLVYPALLSRVADAFRERLVTGDRIKNELTYKSAFAGAEAVDLIMYIIKTNDRNLALLLGRALDAQKFFHDVTYDHRLRDSAVEVYQFRERLVDEDHGVNGVFTLLTECYSPTCTRDKLCYSIACPRRLEQQARLNMKPTGGLKRQDSRSSLHADEEKEQKLWIQTVPKDIVDSVSDKEKKRQEVICECIYTERDFVKDLEYLRDFWMKPLNLPASPIPEHRREKFIRTVFSNLPDVYSVNLSLAEALTKRQQQGPVVHNIGDIFLQHVPHFEPFIKYGANQLYGKYEFEKEKSSNPNFAKFVEERERMKESRKLELNGYLTKPTTRLARYPLLLEAILKATADDNPDKQDLPKAIAMIRDFLTKVNAESGKSENHFNLMQLNQQLIFRPGEHVDLKLTEEGRQLIFKGALKKTAVTDSSADINAFLFDHALLLVRIKMVNKREQYKVYRKPIPLELLVIAPNEDSAPKGGVAKRPSSSLIPGNKMVMEAKKVDAMQGRGFPITFQHLGRRGYTMTLHTPTLVGRKKWMEHIETQQSVLRDRSSIYTKTTICEGFFTNGNRINCLVPIDGGRKLVVGTDTGIFVCDRRPRDGQKVVPRKALEINKVEQVDVLEEYATLLVLSEKSVLSYPVETLEQSDSQILNKRGKKIMGHTNFFKAGVCLGRVLVCCVKSSTLSSTVKVLEPLDSLARGKKQPALKKLLGGQDTLKPFKEFYIPAESSSIHFLRSKLCVGCAKGFEIVSLETLETQPLLDPADTSLDFIQRRESVKPVAIYRFAGEFLLNYSDFSFFVNRNGWRARPDWQIAWEGQPQSFALSYPYILAFEPSFIEIRSLETGGLVHIIVEKNIRMLHESTREIIYAYEDDNGEDVIASLDFWTNSKKDNKTT